MTIWDKISDLWWRGHSSTHHNRELPDLARMKRDIKKIKDPAIQAELQRLIDQEEREAREAEEKGL